MASRVRIRCREPPSVPRRGYLQKLLQQEDIYYTRLAELKDGWVVFTARREDEATIFAPRARKLLEENGFTPLMPPQLRAQLTLVLKKLDWSVFLEMGKLIQDEIAYRIPYAAGKIKEISKMEYHNR